MLDQKGNSDSNSLMPSPDISGKCLLMKQNAWLMPPVMLILRLKTNTPAAAVYQDNNSGKI